MGTMYIYLFILCIFIVHKYLLIYLIFSSDRPGLKGLAEIGRLGQAVLRALRIELDRNHTMPIKGDVTVCDALLGKIPSLR